MIRASRREAALLVVADLVLLTAAFLLAYLLRFHYSWLVVVDTPPAPGWNYLQALGVALLVFLGVLWRRGLYERVYPRGIDVVEESARAATFASITLLAASFFYREWSYSRSVGLLTWALLLCGLPLPRILLLTLRRRRYARGEGLVPALLVGASTRAYDLYERLRAHRRYGLDVLGVVRPNGSRPAGDGAPAGEGLAAPVLGDVADLEAIVQRTGAREVLLSDALERLELFQLMELCARLRVETRIIPHIYDLFITAGDLTELQGVPFISTREHRRGRLSLAVKRAFDLAVGGTLLLASLPLLGLLAVLIRRGSPGAALFRQRRVGQNGAVFSMWKLRTMVDGADRALPVDVDALEQPVFKLDQDPRVTSLGRWLRRWSLDELPQLWNVVRGDMSLVGPRPEEESVVAHYDAHHRRRLKAKPGLTGLQQIEARASTDLDERVRLDVYYIRRRSFLFDLWVLLRTPFAVLHGRGAV